MSQPSRVLIRSVNWLGDAIMSTPALMALRKHWAGAHFAMLTPEKLAGLWEHHPAVDQVIPFTKQESPWAIGSRLRREKFETAVVFPNSFKSALEPFAARIPRRIGFGGQLRSMLLTEAFPRPAEVQMRKRTRAEIVALNKAGIADHSYTLAGHHIRHYLHLAGRLGGDSAPTPPVLRVTDAEVAAARAKFGLGPSKVFGINPGAEYGPAKRWPRERFVEAALEVSRQAAGDWVVFGAPADVETANWIAAQLNGKVQGAVRVAAGQTTLRELCAGLKLCSALLTNDTGPMHVAAALGTPVVVPFGSTSPELTGPDPLGRGRHRIVRAGVPCSPCFLRECPIDFRCMTSISPKTIAEEILTALHSTAQT